MRQDPRDGHLPSVKMIERPSYSLQGSAQRKQRGGQQARRYAKPAVLAVFQASMARRDGASLPRLLRRSLSNIGFHSLLPGVSGQQSAGPSSSESESW